jgi:hypothetical protein
LKKFLIKINVIKKKQKKKIKINKPFGVSNLAEFVCGRIGLCVGWRIMS